ncbi:carboxymuconolactone decarboxylase family protein [Glaciihabitans sp. dw_435]|uniref:carboxymuconolactone decarboxylase family protein n=1 Tax=Glaciihabitans sp. dw_435 TaxID=2720081 RepID=UPI001BD2B2A3|nr:carboxymuconolactone decarboxylase family protein [Glaciihabitans sp. dw_435]
MTVITTIPEDEATGDVARLYADDIDDQGFVAAHSKVLALNMEAYDAWEKLIGAIAHTMDKRRYELVTLAAALGVGSRHCRLAHGRKSLRFFDEDQLIRIAHDYRSAGLSDADVAMMAFAEKVSTNSSGMTNIDSLELRDFGFSDTEIVNIALAAAARNYFSRAIQALAVDVEVPTDISEELAKELVRGIPG